MSSGQPDIEPAPSLPLLLQSAADPLRWRLLRALADQDRTVSGLCEAVGRPQNLVSYHLRRLRDAGLVSSRRSSADGRDTYYALDLACCEELFSEASASLHPGLSRAMHSASAREPEVTDPASVLFVCTGNSSRSQIAEALLMRVAGGRVIAASAGLRPKPVHPHTAVVLAEHGIDASGLRSKHLDELAGSRFEYAVTLCDRAREACPEPVPGARTLHWSIPDPSEAGEGPEALAAFRAVAASLETRIRYLLAAIAAETTKGTAA